MVNTFWDEQKTMPRKLKVQVDGAFVNKNNLVIAFLAQYVLHGVFEEAKLLFLLENHAHDIYDAFQAIHASKVERHVLRCFVPCPSLRV